MHVHGDNQMLVLVSELVDHGQGEASSRKERFGL
jgi:hypothetical protein